MPERTTCGEALIDLLARYGVDTVFGIPGVHTLDFCRGLAGSTIRHVQARNEAFDAEDWATAAAEQAILNRYYPAVLERVRNPDGNLRHAFPPDRVQRLQQEGAVLVPTYESAAGGNRIWIWPGFVAPALFGLALLVAVPLFMARLWPRSISDDR